ncbi:hypothetical protein PM082_017745 [Marasmius tenuissimus]|nr:hypothetical protein PM082_017745 [Marasmius tenuissimus]
MARTLPTSVKCLEDPCLSTQRTCPTGRLRFAVDINYDLVGRSHLHNEDQSPSPELTRNQELCFQGPMKMWPRGTLGVGPELLKSRVGAD